MERSDIAERFTAAKRAGMQRAKALQSAGMPILVHGPMFAAGPSEISNPLVRQLLTAKKELLVPDGNTRPVTLQGRAAVYTKNSKELSALLIQPTRNEGLVFLGRYADTPSGLIFIPSEPLNLSPKLDADFTYARNVAMVVKVYSSTRSTSNSLLQGTMDAVSLFDYRDLTSSDRAAIMKASPGDNSYVVGIPASMGVCLTMGPEGIPDEFNQPESITGRDDRGNDLKYDFFSYRTDGRPKLKWGAEPATIAKLSVDDGSLVPNLINAPLRVQGILTADNPFVIGIYIHCRSAARGKMTDKGEYIDFTVYDYYPSTPDKLYPGTGGPFNGVQFCQEYSAEAIAASAIKDEKTIEMPFIITKVECIIGKIGGVGADEGTVHWAVGSLIVPGYFGSINGPTSVVLLNGFDNECESSCGQSIEIQASQLVEATPSGSLNQYIDPSSSLQRFSDSSMLSLAMVAFNTGADGLRRAWVGTAYTEYVNGINENRKQVGTVISTLQAAGPLGDLGRQLGNLVSGIPIIGGLAKGALGGIGDMIDNTLFAAGMPVAGRTGFAAGPEDEIQDPAEVEVHEVATQTGPRAGQSPPPSDEPEAEATMHKLISLETPGISAFTDQTYSRGPMARYQYAMKQLQKSRINASLVEWGTTPEEVAETLTELYHKCTALMDEESVPDALLLKIKGGLAKITLETIRCCKGLPPIHSSPEAIGILSEPVLTRRLRTGLCAGSLYSPNGVARIAFGDLLVTPKVQIPATEAMALHANNFMGALQATLSGRSTYPDGDWGRYAYFPVMEKVDSEIVGSVETLILSNRAVMDRGPDGTNVAARYRKATFTMTEEDGESSPYILFLENSFLPNDIKAADPDEIACLHNIAIGCYFTGVPSNTFVACPAFDKVLGPSLGLAVAAASLGLNTDAVYTGALTPTRYPGPLTVTEVGYLPAKISAAGAVNKMLICPNQPDATSVLMSDPLNQGLFASMSDILAGKAQRNVSAIIVNNLTEAMLASASLRFARKAEKMPVDVGVIEEQKRLASEQAALADQFKARDPALLGRTWPVMVGKETYDIPLFDMNWWKGHSSMFGPGNKQIKVTPATLQSHMEHGSYKRLLGLATQVQARYLASVKTRPSAGGGGALTRVGQEIRMRRSGILQPTKQTPKRPKPSSSTADEWSWGDLERTAPEPDYRPAKVQRTYTTDEPLNEEDVEMPDYGL